VARRVAVIADVHGNTPALEAVLADAGRSRVDTIVVAGDVMPGPEPVEVLWVLRGLGEPVRFVRGNGDREVVEAYDAGRRFDPSETDPARRTASWTAERIDHGDRNFLAAFEDRVEIAVDGVGDVLVCHGTPRSDEEIVTSLTPDEVVERALVDVTADVVVGGHTHVQYDRLVSGRRIVNAGSVGMPYEGRRGAFWLLLGPDGVELRRTEYDVAAAGERILATGYPDVRELVDEILLAPPDPGEVERYFEGVAAERGER
jgi:putative phosphoesterase